MQHEALGSPQRDETWEGGTGLVDGDAGLISSIIVAATFAAILVLVKNFLMDRWWRSLTAGP